jgi:ABC-2 type transport system ATP-binding protein
VEAIITEELTYRYGDLTAVDHVSFCVAEGEILGFLGPGG